MHRESPELAGTSQRVTTAPATPPLEKSGLGLPEAGYSLVELLVTSLLVLLVLSSVLVLVDGLRDAHHEQQEVLAAQQMARVALMHLQRDSQLAGVGLVWLIAPLPVVIPRADGGIEIRHNQQQVTSALVADMASPSAPIVVADASGFEGGMMVAVYDSMGAIDTVTLTGVDQAAGRLFHAGTGKAYTVADGTAVAFVETLTDSLQPMGASFDLLRQEGNGAPQTVATNVRSLTITYYDNATPPQPFVPATESDQLRIRAIVFALEIETENDRLYGTDRRAFMLRTRVAPRALVLS